ncbi:hypothetical protein JCM1393_02980 [Clostridium carnis]
MKKLIGKPEELKKVNTSIVLESIKKRESATRGEIVKDTGISHTTVRNLLSELLEKDEIISIGLDKSSGGRRAERYTLNINKKYIVVFLITGEFLFYNIVNILGGIVKSDNIEIKENNIEEVMDSLLEKLFNKYKKIKAIGINVPGIINSNGYLTGKNIEKWRQIEINKFIEEKYNIKVVMENDLNSAVLGFTDDYKMSLEKDKAKNLNIVYIHFSKLGVGAGILINDKLVKGKDNFAGELGFIPMKNSYVNELISKEISDNYYIEIVINIISILNCIINPNIIVVGGDDFRYNLVEKIKEKNLQINKINTEIIEIRDCNKYSMKGITKKTLEIINNEFKLIYK